MPARRGRPTRQPADPKPNPADARVRETELTPLAYRHHKVQRLRRLVGRRSARDAERCFVVEGAKVLGEALSVGVRIESVFVDRTALGPADSVDGLLDRAHAAGSRIYNLEPGAMARVVDTVTPQPVVAIVPRIDVPLARLQQDRVDLVVVCVDVRDPGNAGTVLRSAEAAGAGGVVCCDGSVDVFNPKTVRASAGALFHVPVVSGGNAVQVLEQFGKWGLRRLGTVARGGVDYAVADLSGPVAIVLGNEARGLPAGLEGVLDGQVTIPMAGRIESLNVGMAAAVVCFEAARQRRVSAAGSAATTATGRASAAGVPS